MNSLIIVILFLFPLWVATSSFDFKKVIYKYTQNSGVRMKFEKNTYLKLLKKTRKSQGEIFLSGNSMLLKVEDALNTQILFDRNNLWYITEPKGGKRQVLKMDFRKKENSNTMLSFLFDPHSFFKEFQFISSQSKGRALILKFEPVDKNSQTQSLSVKVEGTLILQAWLKWKNLGNIEEYTFSNIRFNQKFSPNLFKIAQ